MKSKAGRRMLTLALSAVMASSLLLAGCGSDEEAANKDTEKKTEADKKTEKDTEKETEKKTEKKEEETTEPSTKASYDANSLMAYYSFDGDDYLADSSGNNLALKSLGTKGSDNGKNGKGLEFDGVGGGIELPSDLFQKSGFTFAAWVKLDEDRAFARILNAGGTVDYFFLITSNNNDSNSAYGGAFKFRKADDNKWYLCNQGADDAANQALGHFTVGEWTHVAFTLQDGAAKLYINGEPVASYEGIAYTMADFGASGTYLGKSSFDTDPYFKGYMDEIYFYNYALDAAAVTELMNK